MEKSKFGIFPSALVAAFLAPAWPARTFLGARGLEAAAALTWAAGVALSAVGFLSLARVLRPGLSPLWAPAFVAGTYLWPYAAESFLEPWAGGLLALGAAQILTTAGSPFRRGACGGILWALGACLKPVLWTTATVLVLAAAFEERRRSGLRRGLAAGVITGLAAVVLLFLAANVTRTGSPLDVGYGPETLIWVRDVLPGLLGLTVSPGRGLFLFAPVVVGSLVAIRRLSGPAALICVAAPALLVFVVSRWHLWDGSTCWGPRLVLGALPLLAAPAVLRPRWAVPLLVAGALLNLPGVLVAPGAWISFAERLTPQPGVDWPLQGSERVSAVPSLSPLYGHVWLLVRRDGRPALLPPWQGQVAGSVPALRPADFISPAWLRAAAGLPPVRPMIPRLLFRAALGWTVRDRIADALGLAEEAARLAPGDRDAQELVASLRSASARKGRTP